MNIIANALSKYLLVFFKNFSKENLQLSLLKKEGVLTNLQLREQVISEILDIPVMRVRSGSIGRLVLKAPSLTRLKNHPVILQVQNVCLDLEEPLPHTMEFSTMFKEFLLKMNKKKKTKYSLTDKIVDGIQFEFSKIRIRVFTFGWYPSKVIGPWTPPYYEISMEKAMISTCNHEWKHVLDLKTVIPRNSKTKEFFFLHKMGTLEGIKANLVYLPYNHNGEKHHERVYSVFSNVRAELKITQKKTFTGTILGVVLEIHVNTINIDWKRENLGAFLHFAIGLTSCARRLDLLDEYSRSKEKLNTETTSNISSTEKKSMEKTSAFKMVNRSISSLPTPESTEDLDDLDSDEESTMSEDPSVNEMVGKEGSKELQSPRVVVNFALDHFFVTIKESEKRDYKLEMLGLDFAIITEENLPGQKNYQLTIPFFQFYIHDHDDYSGTTDLERKNRKIQKELNTILGPRFRLLSKEEFIQYTIDIAVWPKFLSNNRYDPKHMAMKLSYPNYSEEKAKFFSKGKEMIRLKAALNKDGNTMIECRCQPIQFIANSQELIELTEFVMGSFELDIEPNKEDKVQPPVVEKRSGEDLDDTQSGDTNVKDISLLFEIRSPIVLIPANSKSSQSDAVSQLIRGSLDELIITSDGHLTLQDWLKKGKNTLYREKGFPSADSDFTSRSDHLWEVLPHKLRCNICKFQWSLLPSIRSAPQYLMEPISMHIDIGINQEDMSDFHLTLPKAVIMYRVPKIGIHLTQNQAIILLEIANTYLEDPPEFTNAFVQATKSLVQRGATVAKNRKAKVKKSDEKEIPNILVVGKMDDISLAMHASTKDVESIFEMHKSENSSCLSSVDISDIDIVVELKQSSRDLLFKLRVKDALIQSPPKDLSPSGTNFASLSYHNKYIFSQMSQEELEKLNYFLKVRYIQPMNHLVNRSEDPLVCDPRYAINSDLDVKLLGAYIGVNVNSLFQVIQFIESRDNVFESSPLQILDETIQQFKGYIHTKYFPHKPITTEEDEDDIDDTTIREVKSMKMYKEKLATSLNKAPKVPFPPFFRFDLRCLELHSINSEKEFPFATGVAVNQIIIKHEPTNVDTTKKQFDIFNDEFTLSVDINDVLLHSLKPTPNFEVAYIPHIKPFKISFSYYGDYTRPLSERNTAIRMDPLVFDLNADVLSDMVNLFYSQSEEFWEWQYLLSYLKKPQKNIKQNLDRLKSNLDKVSRIVTRAQFCHKTLTDSLGEMKYELKEKTVALGETINDKMRLTQMIADLQTKRYDNSTKDIPEQKIVRTPAYDLEHESCLISGDMYAILPGEEKFKSLHCYLIGSRIFITKSKVGRKEILSTKYHMLIMDVTASTEIMTTFAPVLKYGPQKVLFITSTLALERQISRLILWIKEEKQMLMWLQGIQELIEQKKLQTSVNDRKKQHQENSVQTEETSFITKDQLTEKKNEAINLIEVENLFSQFQSVKETLEIAKRDEQILRERMTELNKFVIQIEKEKAIRHERNKERLKLASQRENEHRIQSDKLAELEKNLKKRESELKVKNDTIAALKKKLETVSEESNLASNQSKRNLILLANENSKLREENTRLKQFQEKTASNTNVSTPESSSQTRIHELLLKLKEKDVLIEKLKANDEPVVSKSYKALPPIPIVDPYYFHGDKEKKSNEKGT